jgi:hypothetical protein
MASPNSYNSTTTRDLLIEDAMKHVNLLGEGESPSAAAVTENARILNMMLKLRASEIPLWAIRRGIILPFTESSSINTNSHVVINYDTTTISTDEAASQTTLSVTDSTGMSDDDNIGIEMDDGTMHWTTISSVPNGTSVIVAVAIDDEASAGNMVYWYTASADRVVRPLRIMDANILKVSDDSSWEVTVDERKDYFNLSKRTTTGTPNRIFYDPVLGSRVADPATAAEWYGTIYVYPQFNNGDYVIEFTYQEPMQDLDSATDNPYWPQEFYLPIMLELAALLGPKAGVDLKERQALFAEAKMYRDEALETITEEGSMFLMPEDRRG